MNKTQKTSLSDCKKILLKIKIPCARYFSCSKVFCSIVKFTVYYSKLKYTIENVHYGWLRQPIRLSTNIHDLDTRLNLHRITSGFHGAFATGVASQQGTLTLPDITLGQHLSNVCITQNKPRVECVKMSTLDQRRADVMHPT